MNKRRTMLLLALIALLVACSNAPNPGSGSSGIWDQSNFETANWN